MSQSEFDMDEPLTCAYVAESSGVRHSLVLRLAQQGLIETIDSGQEVTGEPALPRRSLMQLRRMQRLRRDLGVNFAGAAVILDLVERISVLSRELSQLRNASR